MGAVLTTPEDICNAALRQIGYVYRIGNLFDGTMVARFALDLYGQVRDSLLREGCWGFAERTVSATLLKYAPSGGYTPITQWSPVYPPPPWFYQYTYPDDCLQLRSVKPAQLFLPSFDPTPNVFDIYNDTSYPHPLRCVLCNVPNAILVYTGQVVDPQTWEVSFTETLIEKLAQKFVPALADLKAEAEAMEKLKEVELAQDEAEAKTEQG